MGSLARSAERTSQLTSCWQMLELYFQPNGTRVIQWPRLPTSTANRRLQAGGLLSHQQQFARSILARKIFRLRALLCAIRNPSSSNLLGSAACTSCGFRKSWHFSLVLGLRNAAGVDDRVVCLTPCVVTMIDGTFLAPRDLMWGVLGPCQAVVNH